MFKNLEKGEKHHKTLTALENGEKPAKMASIGQDKLRKKRQIDK